MPRFLSKHFDFGNGLLRNNPFPIGHGLSSGDSSMRILYHGVGNLINSLQVHPVCDPAGTFDP